MEHDYSRHCLIKGTSPLKPRYLNGGDDDGHNGGDKQTIVSLMCKNLLEGDSRIQGGQRRPSRAPTSPTELPYDRGLQRDGGYTMYTPEFNFQEDDVSHYNTSYNKAATTAHKYYPRMTTDLDGKECLPTATEIPTKTRYHNVYGDNQEAALGKRSRQHLFVQGYHPYVLDGKRASRVEHEGKTYRNNAAPGKCTKRRKRHDKKVQSRKQSSRREHAQKIQAEKDVAAEWTNLIHSTIMNSAKKPEADWELMNSTTPPMAKSHRQWCQEILGQRNRPDRKRNRNQEVNMSCTNAGRSGCCLDWKRYESSRNRFYNDCTKDGSNKDEAANNSFIDNSCHRNPTKITFSSACDEQSGNSSMVSNRTACNPDCHASRQALLNNCPVRGTGCSGRNTVKCRSDYGEAARDDTLSYRINNRSIPEEVARAPWKCTVWENRVPSSTPQPIAWSCEMYSHTSLTEPDVGMASTDQYRSYINARNQLKAADRATKDFACQESLPRDAVQKAVHSAITQTEDLLVTNAAGVQHFNNARDVKLALQERGHWNSEGSVDKNVQVKSNESVSCRPRTPLSDGSSHKKEVVKSQEYARKPIRIQSNNVSPKSPIKFIMSGKVMNNALMNELNEHLILTSMVPSENNSSLEGTNLKKLTSNQESDKKALIHNILVVPESKLAAIPTLVGNSVSQSEQSTGHDSKECIYWTILPKTNSHQAAREDVQESNQQVKCKVDDRRCRGDSRPDEEGKMSTSVDDESISPFQYYVEEQRITQCSGKVATDVKPLASRRRQCRSTKRSNEMFAGLEKTIRAYEKVTSANEIKEYERYKLGRKKYEEELALKGCEFEIEELKFQKQVSYEPPEDQAIEERFQRSIGNSKQLSEVNKLGRLKETVKLLDSSGSRMDSPLTISLPSDGEDVKTDACFSYQEDCYKKNAAPAGDPSDITPCFTCNSSSSRSASSISRSPRKQRKKTTNTKRKDEASRRKNHKMSRKRSSSLSHSSRESSSAGKEFKKSKRSLKRQKSLPRKKDTVAKRYNGKPPSPLEKASKRKSSSRSSSSLSNFSHKSVRAKGKDEITHSTLRSVDTDDSRLITSKQNGGTPRSSMLRRQVKKQYQVTAPELMSNDDFVCHNDLRAKIKEIPSSTNSLGLNINQDVLNLKHILKQREANFSKSDPFGSVNTEELNLSILKLYREIHKLQKQLECNRDDSELQSRRDKSGRYSPVTESIEKTLPFSSSCRSPLDNTDCQSLNTTLKENSVNTTSSSEWIRSTGTQQHKDEKPVKLCQLSKGSHSKYCSGDCQENSTPTIICRAGSPQKMAQKKMIPCDASLSRAARPIYRKLAAPCLKCWRQSNTRATRKQNAPSPSNEPTDPGCCWGTDDDDKVDDEDDVAVTTSVSKMADSSNAIVHNLPLSTSSITKYSQAAENVSNKLTVEMCQKRLKDNGLKIEPGDYESFTGKPTNEKREINSGQMDFRCFGEDLHLLLTSASHPDRDQLAVEKHYSDVYGQSSPGNEETRSARSYVCSSSWISSPGQRADTRVSPGLPPDETGYLGCAVPSSKPDENSRTQVAETRYLEVQTMDGNNSKLDENEQVSERIMRLEKKLPTSVTCRKLKIFGATNEQTLQFYNSAVLEGSSSQNRRIRSPDTSKQQNSNVPNIPSNLPQTVNDFPPDEAPAASLFVEPDQTVTKDEHRGEYRVMSPCRQAEQKWQPAVRPKIPYSVPHRTNLAKSPPSKANEFYDGTVLARSPEKARSSPPKDKERKFEEHLSRENSFDVGTSERQAGKNIQRRISGDSASPRTHSVGRHYSKPSTRRVKHESPIEKIIELLTDKSSSQAAHSNQKCNPMYGAAADYENEYREKFSFRKSSPDSTRRKVFEPNKTYSEFERSPRSEFSSPNSFSTFFHQNVQQVTDYIQSFKNYNYIEKNLVDKVGPCSQMSSRETKPQCRRRFDPGMSSNNIYGQCPSSNQFEKDNLDNRNGIIQSKNNDNQFPDMDVRSPKDKGAEPCRPDSGKTVYVHHDPRQRQSHQTHRQTYIMASSRRRKQDCNAPSVRAGANHVALHQSQSQSHDVSVDCKQSPPQERVQSHVDYSPANHDSSTRVPSHSSRSPPGSIDTLKRGREHCAGSILNTPTLSKKPSSADEFLNSFTVNNNSNQGDPYRGNETIYVEPANQDRCGQTVGGVKGVSFGPKNLSYTACRRPNGLYASQQLQEPTLHNELNIGSLGSLRTLNLVGCVKDMFFKSFKADLNMMRNETGDHACPPKSSTRLKLIPGTVIGDSSVDAMDGKNKKTEKRMEETMLCEYIAGRKQRSSGDEQRLPANTRISPLHVPHCNRSHYISKQCVEANKDYASDNKRNERSSLTPEIDNIPLSKKCARISPVKPNKNSLLYCDRVKVCSLEKGSHMLHNMAAQYEWSAGRSAINRATVTRTEDSSKAIPHYSDAIRTGSRRVHDSVRPLNEAFTDFCSSGDESRKHRPVKDNGSQVFHNPEQFHKRVGDSMQRLPEVKSPRKNTLAPEQNYKESHIGGKIHQESESSIMSSFEKMMQGKRPCYAEECQLRTRDHTNPSDASRHYCNPQASHQRFTVHPALDTDGNNSSNEIGDGLPSPRQYSMTAQSMNIQCDHLESGERHSGDRRGQHDVNVQCKQMVYVQDLGGQLSHTSGILGNPRNEQRGLLMGECGESQLDISIDSPELKNGKSVRPYILENCSEIMVTESPEKFNLLDDDFRYGGAADDSWCDKTRSQENDAANFAVDEGLANMSLDVTQDEQGYEDEHRSTGSARGDDKDDEVGDSNEKGDTNGGPPADVNVSMDSVDGCVKEIDNPDKDGDEEPDEESSEYDPRAEISNVSSNSSSVSCDGSRCQSSCDSEESSCDSSDSCDSLCCSDSDGDNDGDVHSGGEHK